MGGWERVALSAAGLWRAPRQCVAGAAGAPRQAAVFTPSPSQPPVPSAPLCSSASYSQDQQLLFEAHRELQQQLQEAHARLHQERASHQAQIARLQQEHEVLVSQVLGSQAREISAKLGSLRVQVERQYLRVVQERVQERDEALSEMAALKQQLKAVTGYAHQLADAFGGEPGFPPPPPGAGVAGAGREEAPRGGRADQDGGAQGGLGARLLGRTRAKLDEWKPFRSGGAAAEAAQPAQKPAGAGAAGSGLRGLKAPWQSGRKWWWRKVDQQHRG